MSTTFDRLGKILVRDYGVAPERLAPGVALGSLGVDSLGAVELLWTVEDEFRITLPTEPVELPTLADVVAYIDAAIAAQAVEPGSALVGDEPAVPTVPAA